MASFYGNIKNNSRSSFIFDRIYNSRYEMEMALTQITDENGATAGDGVFINRYVLINYGYSATGAYQQIPASAITPENYTNYYFKANGDSDIASAASSTYDIVRSAIAIYEKKNYVTRFDFNLEENQYYATNRNIDAEHYFASFDHTVWQKIYSDNQEKYILVAELNPEAPTYELITDAPSCMNGIPHFDLGLSSELNYVYHVPKNWDIVLNNYNPDQKSVYDDNQSNTYWYYENDLIDQDKTFNIKEEYPFINKKGFNSATRIFKPTDNEGITINDTKSLGVYPIHQYKAIMLTQDTYVPNKYYVHNTNISLTEKTSDDIFNINNKYYIGEHNNNSYYIDCPLIKDTETTYKPIREKNDSQVYYLTQGTDNAFLISQDDFDNTVTYYQLTIAQKIESTDIIEAHQKDTKRLDIYLPSIGNAVASLYDIIYGRPRWQTTTFYTSDELFQTYIQDDIGEYFINGFQYSNVIEENLSSVADSTYYIPVQKITANLIGYANMAQFENFTQFQESNGIYQIKNNRYNLPDDKLNLLSPEYISGTYEIPVYILPGTSKILMRPYNDEKIFSSLEAPYDNLSGDNLSAGQTLGLLKRYLSELRYLMHGDTGNGTGLQSDWTLDDDEGFGYIYHKPKIITSFIETEDEEIVPDKHYYVYQYDNNTHKNQYTLVENPQSDNLNMYYEIPYVMPENIESDISIYTPVNDVSEPQPGVNYYTQIEGSGRFQRAYTETGTYNYYPLSNATLSLNCSCLFKAFQVVTVSSSEEISARRYRFETRSTSDNIYLATGNVNISNELYKNKRVYSFDIITDGTPIDTDEIASFTRLQLIEYLTNPSNNISYEIIEVYPENFSANNIAAVDNKSLAYISYFADITRTQLTSFNPNITYFTKSSQPIEQKDYEINTIWDSINLSSNNN